MTRAAHQDIDRLVDALGERAEIEGLAKGVRITLKRTLVRWAIVWSLALAAGAILGASTPWLWWLPYAVAVIAISILAAIFVHRSRTVRKIEAARSHLGASSAGDSGS